MCLNRQCQNVSVFGVHECSAKCGGRGVSTAFNLLCETYAYVRKLNLTTVSGMRFGLVNMNKSHFGERLAVAA